MTGEIPVSANLSGFDADDVDLVVAAAEDSEAAREVLIRFARAVRAGEPLRFILAGHIANAVFKAYVSGDGGEGENNAFLEALGLQFGHRPRKPGDWYEIGRAVEEKIRANGGKKMKAIAEVEQEISAKNGGAPSVSTIKRRHAEYLKKLQIAKAAGA